MFNTIIRSPERVSVDVTEKRAPTDESIRLAEEYRDKLKAQWLATYTLEDTKLNVRWDVFREDFGRKIRVIGKMKINGQEHSLDFSVDQWDFKFDEPDTFLVKLHQHLTEQIAAVLTIDLMHSRPVQTLVASKI
jgi:hypothetical protein